MCTVEAIALHVARQDFAIPLIPVTARTQATNSHATAVCPSDDYEPIRTKGIK